MTTFASRTEWLAARNTPAPDGGPMLGASDVATPFGLGFVSPARAAAILRGDIPRDPEPDAPNDPRAVGTRLEHVALAEYAVHHRPAGAWPLADQITRWAHPDRPWLAVSPDALIVDGFGGDVIGLVEVKIPRSAAALSEYAPDAPDGYGLAATLADPRGPAIPRRYALQVLDVERLDTTLNREASEGKNQIIMGVEMDTDGAPVAYWMANAALGRDPTGKKLQRIPAGEIIHLFMTDDPEQVRGVPWMHAVMLTVNDLKVLHAVQVPVDRVERELLGVVLALVAGDRGGAVDGCLVRDQMRYHSCHCHTPCCFG
jgi:hypothetical protein